VIAREIVEDLTAALVEFEAVAAALESRVLVGLTRVLMTSEGGMGHHGASTNRGERA
jgi:hypothetical protein